MRWRKEINNKYLERLDKKRFGQRPHYNENYRWKGFNVEEHLLELEYEIFLLPSISCGEVKSAEYSLCKKNNTSQEHRRMKK
jgi:hypothetical protein